MTAVVANPVVDTGRDDYLALTWDVASLASQLGAGLPRDTVFWDTSVLPSAQAYIEDTPAGDLDADYLWRTARFLEAVAAYKPTIVPGVSAEADGMMGALDRRARAKAKDASPHIANTLRLIGTHAKRIERAWRARAKAFRVADPELVQPVKRLVFELDVALQLSKGRLRHKRDTDWNLAAAAITTWLVVDHPVRVCGRDRDVMKLVATPVSYLIGADVASEYPISVWAFAADEQVYTDQSPVGWNVGEVTAARAVRAVGRAGAGVTKALDAVLERIPEA